MRKLDDSWKRLHFFFSIEFFGITFISRRRLLTLGDLAPQVSSLVGSASVYAAGG